MRWTKPQHGDERIRTVYAFTPIHLPGNRVVWLEHVTIRERYCVRKLSKWEKPVIYSTIGGYRPAPGAKDTEEYWELVDEVVP